MFIIHTIPRTHKTNEFIWHWVSPYLTSRVLIVNHRHLCQIDTGNISKQLHWYYTCPEQHYWPSRNRHLDGNFTSFVCCRSSMSIAKWLDRISQEAVDLESSNLTGASPTFPSDMTLLATSGSCSEDAAKRPPKMSSLTSRSSLGNLAKVFSFELINQYSAEHHTVMNTWTPWPQTTKVVNRNETRH